MKEYLDTVNELGEPTGETVERVYAHENGIRHRTAHLWLVRIKDGKVQLLLQKRSETKESYPGCYDISSAGHIPAGDDFTVSAVRELHEELGISASEDELVCCGDRKISTDHIFCGRPFHDRQVSRVFFIWRDLDESAFTLQKEEVESVRWMDFDECFYGVAQGTFKNCIASEELEMLRKKLSEVVNEI